MFTTRDEISSEEESSTESVSLDLTDNANREEQLWNWVKEMKLKLSQTYGEKQEGNHPHNQWETSKTKIKHVYFSILSYVTPVSQKNICVLGKLAEELQCEDKYASCQVVEAICSKFLKYDSVIRKIAFLNLMDYIVKNLDTLWKFRNCFEISCIVKKFPDVVEQADHNQRKYLYMLRNSWSQYFQTKILKNIDLKCQKVDPAWKWYTFTFPDSPSPEVYEYCSMKGWYSGRNKIQKTYKRRRAHGHEKNIEILNTHVPKEYPETLSPSPPPVSSPKVNIEVPEESKTNSSSSSESESTFLDIDLPPEAEVAFAPMTTMTTKAESSATLNILPQEYIGMLSSVSWTLTNSNNTILD